MNPNLLSNFALIISAIALAVQIFVGMANYPPTRAWLIEVIAELAKLGLW